MNFNPKKLNCIFLFDISNGDDDEKHYDFTYAVNKALNGSI